MAIVGRYANMLTFAARLTVYTVYAHQSTGLRAAFAVKYLAPIAKSLGFSHGASVAIESDMTKRQKALNRKVAWNTAIAEGRMMRSQGGLSFASFATRTDALAAVDRCLMAGMEADIVDPALALAEYVATERS